MAPLFTNYISTSVSLALFQMQRQNNVRTLCLFLAFLFDFGTPHWTYDPSTSTLVPRALIWNPALDLWPFCLRDSTHDPLWLWTCAIISKNCKFNRINNTYDPIPAPDPVTQTETLTIYINTDNNTTYLNNISFVPLPTLKTLERDMVSVEVGCCINIQPNNYFSGWQWCGFVWNCSDTNFMCSSWCNAFISVLLF